MKTFFAILLAACLAAPGYSAAADPAQKKAAAEAKRALAKSKRDARSKSKKQAEHWTCPMHPEIDMPGPGQCPKCHMDLVKKEAGK